MSKKDNEVINISMGGLTFIIIIALFFLIGFLLGQEYLINKIRYDGLCNMCKVLGIN